MTASAQRPRRVDVTVDGTRVAALRAGAGPPVLLLPGFTGGKEDFTLLFGPLVQAGFDVTAIDLPGQHESPGPELASHYAPDRLAMAVLAVATQLGADTRGQVRLLGHSFGGLVARAAVIASPRTFASLVLLSSGPAELRGARRQRIIELEPVLAQGGLPAVYAAMQRLAREDPDFNPPPAHTARFLERRFLHGSPIMLQGMGDALRAEPDRVDELAATQLPTLVVHGAADDAWLPAEQREMARRLAARYAVIPDSAHSAATENPAALAAVLVDFWR